MEKLGNNMFERQSRCDIKLKVLPKRRSRSLEPRLERQRSPIITKFINIFRPSDESLFKAYPLWSPNRVPLTLGARADKKKSPANDSKFMTNQIERLTVYLQQTEGLGIKSSRNIAAMDVNDFLGIFSHLAKFQVPHITINKENYVDEVHEVLHKLKYPYSFNKSYLKTPNAPHAIKHILLMLCWLLDDVPGKSKDHQKIEELEIEIANEENMIRTMKKEISKREEKLEEMKLLKINLQDALTKAESLDILL